MEIGIGLDATLNLSFADQAVLSQEAARLGYTHIWTPESTGQDAFQLCSQRWAASCQVIPEGLTTGIGVSPVLYRTPIAFAISGGTVSQLTGGRFIMGIGAGGAYRPRTRQSLGLPRLSTLALMRDYLTTVCRLVAGDEVTYQGEVVTLHGVKLAISSSTPHAGISGGSGAGDATPGWRVGRWGMPELVYAGANRLEPGTHRRWRDAGQPGPQACAGRRVYPRVCGSRRGCGPASLCPVHDGLRPRPVGTYGTGAAVRLSGAF